MRWSRTRACGAGHSSGPTPKKTTELVNTGYCWKAHVPAEGSSLEGGPLANKYVLEQYHCHWGPDASVGSEHLINGKSYAGEIHYVHWNTKYGSFNEALKYGDGLAVLGVFLEVGKQNAELEKLVKTLTKVPFKDQTAPFQEPLDPAALLPAHGAYFTYSGSLTTPPCNECVIWIVFQDAIEVSQQQLDAFRSLHSSGKENCCQSDKIVNNYRPTLPRGERRVRLGYV